MGTAHLAGLHLREEHPTHLGGDCWGTAGGDVSKALSLHDPAVSPPRWRIAAIATKAPQNPRHFWQLGAGSRCSRPRGGGTAGCWIRAAETRAELSLIHQDAWQPGTRGGLRSLLRDDSFRQGGTHPAQHQLRRQKASCGSPAASLGLPTCPLRGSVGVLLGANRAREGTSAPGWLVPASAHREFQWGKQD